MDKSEVLEELYNRLPNREADRMIDMLLEDDSNLEKVITFLSKGMTPKPSNYNLFSSIETKPIYKTVAKFMSGELEDPLQICKMLSSIVTQIFIQCELRGLNSSQFDFQPIFAVIQDISEAGDTINGEILIDIKNILESLGWNENQS